VIVVDSSAVLAVLLKTASIELEKRVLAERLHAPHLIDVEVLQVVRRWVLSRELPLDRASQAIADFRQFRINRYHHEPLIDRIWELRLNLTAYDAAYVALAEMLGTTVLTVDGKMARAPGMAGTVELVR